MQRRPPTFAVVLYKRRPLVSQGGKFEAKIRVSHNNTSRYYATRTYMATDAELQKVLAGVRLSQSEREQKDQIDRCYNRAKEIADSMPAFDYKKFERQYYTDADTGERHTVLAIYAQKIRILAERGQAGTAKGYEHARRSLFEVDPETKQPGKQYIDLTLADITPEWLYAYQNRVLKTGRVSLSTVSKHVRTLREIYNAAIAEGTADAALYPFGGRKGYKVPQTAKSTRYRPLTSDQVRALVNLPLERMTPEQEHARDMWLFCLFCNGCNTVDVFSLRWKDVEADRIRFNRTKTGNAVEVYLTQPMQDIIDKHGTRRTKTGRVFASPIDNPAKWDDFKRAMLRKWERVAALAGLPDDIPLHNMSARRTFARIQKLADVPEELTGEAMGHKSKSVTSIYTGGAAWEQKKELADNVLRYAGLLD